MVDQAGRATSQWAQCSAATGQSGNSHFCLRGRGRIRVSRRAKRASGNDGHTHAASTSLLTDAILSPVATLRLLSITNPSVSQSSRRVTIFDQSSSSPSENPLTREQERKENNTLKLLKPGQHDWQPDRSTSNWAMWT